MRTLYGALVEKEGNRIMGRLRERIKEYTLSTLHEMLTSGDKVSSHTSLSIVITMCQHQPQPEQPAYMKSDDVTHVISGPTVWGALFTAHAVLLRGELTKWIGLFQTMPQVAPMAGWLWEVFCHAANRLQALLVPTSCVREFKCTVPVKLQDRVQLFVLENGTGLS